MDPEVPFRITLLALLASSMPISDMALIVRPSIGNTINAARKLKGIATIVSAALRNPIVNQRMTMTSSTPVFRLSESTPIRVSTYSEVSQVLCSARPAGSTRA